VGIVLFDEVEVLDACGPFEVFSTASRVSLRDQPDAEVPFEVTMVSAGESREVTARGGLAMVADRTLGDAGRFDILVMPGGVTRDVERDERLRAWLRTQRETADLIAAVCTGAFVLAEADLLRGPVTTHWEDVAELAARFPDLTVEYDVRYIDHGDVATSAGVSAGIDLSLEIVERFAGGDVAAATARQMDYPWNRNPLSLRQRVEGEGLV